MTETCSLLSLKVVDVGILAEISNLSSILITVLCKAGILKVSVHRLMGKGHTEPFWMFFKSVFLFL